LSSDADFVIEKDAIHFEERLDFFFEIRVDLSVYTTIWTKRVSNTGQSNEGNERVVKV